MGLLDFVKEAGQKLGVLAEDEVKEAPAQTAAAAQEIGNKRKAVALLKLVEKNNLKAEDLNIRFRDGVAMVSGKAPSQSDKEKIVLVIGNVAGVSQVDDRLEVEKPEPEARFHTVVRGDNLSKISKQYYGSARHYPVIFEANRPMLTDPDKIYPGQVLRIPPLED